MPDSRVDQPRFLQRPRIGLFTLLHDKAYRKNIATHAIAVAKNRTWTKAFDGLLACYDRCRALGKRAPPRV